MTYLGRKITGHRPGDPRQRRPVREFEETTVPRRSCETFPPRVHAPGREGVGKPPLTVEQILAWADAHKEQTGTWPDRKSGGVFNAMGENWQALDGALRRGHRGQGGGSSLETLLAEHRHVVPPSGRRRPRKPHRTPLTLEQVLKWADEHYERTGRWPTASSGLIPDTDGESWDAVRQCLQRGCRGLPGGESLLKLLAQFRGKRLECDRPRVTVEQILTWANAHHERIGRWPTRDSGPVHGVPDEKWSRLDAALRGGTRGLPRGLSLSKLLAGHLEIRAPLTVEKILAWVDEHYQRFGQWPHVKSGEVQGVSGLTWRSP